MRVLLTVLAVALLAPLLLSLAAFAICVLVIVLLGHRMDESPASGQVYATDWREMISGDVEASPHDVNGRRHADGMRGETDGVPDV